MKVTNFLAIAALATFSTAPPKPNITVTLSAIGTFVTSHIRNAGNTTMNFYRCNTILDTDRIDNIQLYAQLSGKKLEFKGDTKLCGRCSSVPEDFLEIGPRTTLEMITELQTIYDVKPGCYKASAEGVLWYTKPGENKTVIRDFVRYRSNEIEIKEEGNVTRMARLNRKDYYG